MVAVELGAGRLDCWGRHSLAAGWTEHDPLEIVANARACIDACLAKSKLSASQVGAHGSRGMRAC